MTLYLYSYIGASPKLLTPSEFTSPLKSEATPDSTVPPLLSPASIVASASTDQPSESTVVSGDPRSSTQASVPTLSETQATLTCVSSDTVDSDHESIPPAVNPDKLSQEGQIGQGVLMLDGKENDAAVLEDAPGEEMPSAEDRRKTLDSIMKVLSVDEPNSSGGAVVDDQQPVEEIHGNPPQQQEETAKNPDSEEATQSEGDHSFVAAMNSASFPDVLKSTACQDLPYSEAKGEDSSGIKTEGVGLNESQWPDIGSHVEVERTSKEECNLPEANHVQAALSNEYYHSDGQPVDAGLLMPSAIADLQEADVQGSTLSAELSNSTPDLLDETSSEVKEYLDLEVGTIKTKPKSRRRSRRSRAKQNSGPVTPAGTEVLEVPRLVSFKLSIFDIQEI